MVLRITIQKQITKHGLNFKENNMDNCPECGRMTSDGLAKSAEKYKSRPIFGTDLSKKKSEVVTEARNRIESARGVLDDFQFAYPQWKERVRHVEGLLTCGLVALYNAIEELEKYEKGEFK